MGDKKANLFETPICSLINCTRITLRIYALYTVRPTKKVFGCSRMIYCREYESKYKNSYSSCALEIFALLYYVRNFSPCRIKNWGICQKMKFTHNDLIRVINTFLSIISLCAIQTLIILSGIFFSFFIC